MGIFRESGTDITEDTVLKVTSPGYYEKLVPLLDETPSRIIGKSIHEFFDIHSLIGFIYTIRVIVNYLHWSFVSSMITKTTDEMRELDEKMTENDSNEKQNRFL